MPALRSLLVTVAAILWGFAPMEVSASNGPLMDQAISVPQVRDNAYTEPALKRPADQRIRSAWANNGKQSYVIPVGRARAAAGRNPLGYPTRVTVRNERGNIVGDGPPDEEDEYEVGVPENRPGKLIITTEWSEGPPTTQELDYTRDDLRWDDYGDFVWFSWDFDQNRYVVDTPRRLLGGHVAGLIELYGGAGRLSQDAPTLGVNVGPDTPLFRGAEKIDFYTLGGAVSIGKLGPFNAKLGLDMKWGDETNRFDTAVGNRGFTFQGGTAGGTTGVFSGTPSRGSLETRYDSQKISLLLEHPFPGLTQTESSRIRKSDEVFVTRTRFRYDGDLVFPAFNTVSAEEDWKVTEYTVGLGVGVSGQHKFNKLALSGGVSVNLQYYHGEYDGRHHYICTPCAPGAQNVMQSTDDSKDGFTWGTSLSAAMHYYPNRRAEIFVRGEYAYRDKSVVFAPRVSPNDPPPRLTTDSTDSFRVIGGLRYQF